MTWLDILVFDMLNVLSDRLDAIIKSPTGGLVPDRRKENKMPRHTPLDRLRRPKKTAKKKPVKKASNKKPKKAAKKKKRSKKRK